MVKGLVFDIKRFAIHDGPGIRTTVFLKGCPLACKWCHNPESQLPQPQTLYRSNRCIRCGACLPACEFGAISLNGDKILTDAGLCRSCGSCTAVCHAEAREIVGREMTVRQVIAELERDITFYDESQGGITVSGGEPLMQPEFLLLLLQDCKGAGIHTALDTCGFAPWESLDPIRAYVDLFLYDLKLLDDVQHRRLTGSSNELILRNLCALSKEGHAIKLRVPFIPGVNGNDRSMRRIAHFASQLPHLLGIDLLPFHSIASEKYERIGRAYELQETPSPAKDVLAETAQMMRQYGLQVEIGG